MTTGYKVTEFFKKHHPKKAHKQRFDPTYHYQTRTMKRRFMKTTHKFREYVKSVIKEIEYEL